MNSISVLMVADCLNAVASGNLQSNIYLVDTNKHFGSGAEGQAELSTACKDGQVINWSVVPVDPNSNVALTGFTGDMVNSGVCTPKPSLGPEGTIYQGRVEAKGVANSHLQYSAILEIDGKPMSFDPFLNISVAG